MVKKVLTGIKPTGKVHLGNYLGAIRPALERAQEPQVSSYLFMADYHALTSVWDAKKMREYTYEVAASWLACGLDPEVTTFYRQSDIPEIFEMQWILSCMAAKGLLNRAHAYKAACDRNREQGKQDLDDGINTGTFMYPVLMAADILCVNSDIVPVGKDQVQHVEIARDLAKRFNSTFKPVFKLPEYCLSTEDQVVPGIDGRKMSKSYDNTIGLFLPEKALKKRINKIVTTSKAPEDPYPPEQCNIFNIFKYIATEAELSEIRERYAKGIGWGEAKNMLFEKLNSMFMEPRQKYEALMADKAQIDELLAQGAKKARAETRELLSQLRAAVGID